MAIRRLNFFRAAGFKYWLGLGGIFFINGMTLANQDLLESAGIVNLHSHILSDGTLLRGQGQVVTSYEPSNLPSQHNDFYDASGNSRLQIIDGFCGAEAANNRHIGAHSTKSIGLMIGNAASNPEAMGVAPEAQANHLTYSYNEESTLVCLSRYGAAVSTFSSGFGVNSSADCNFAYTEVAQTWDSVVYQTGHPVTRSVGNSGTPAGHTQLRSLCPGGFHSLNAQAVGKNILAVGTSLNAGSTNRMWDFDLGASVPFRWEFEPAETGELGLLANSSHGPTADGRIKPDLTSPVFAYHVPTLDNGYTSFGNSSAASPTVAGVIALLNQKHRDAYDQQALDSARAKALLIESILDQGNTGPDYWYGWGSVNAEAAVNLIDQDVASNGGHIEALSLSTSNRQADYYFMVDEQTEFSVTMVWNDPPAAIGSGKALVNDMDILLTDPNGTRYLPYVMPYAVSCDEAGTCDESMLTRRASQAIHAAGSALADEDHNRHDNVEKIQIRLAEPIPGPWKLTVRANTFGSDYDNQTVQLVASQMMFADPPTTQLTFLSHVPNENRVVVRAGEQIRFRLDFAAQEGLYLVEYFLRSQATAVSLPLYNMGPNAGSQYIPVSADKTMEARLEAAFSLSEPGLYTYGTRARDRRSNWAGSLVPMVLEFQPQTTFYIEVVE